METKEPGSDFRWEDGLKATILKTMKKRLGAHRRKQEKVISR